MLQFRFSGVLARARHSWRPLVVVTAMAASTLVALSPAANAQEPVDLGAARPFAVFAGASVDNTHNTRVTGDLGVSPGSLVTGFPPGVVDGDRHVGDATAANARIAAVNAYNDIVSRVPTGSLPQQLGGTTRDRASTTPRPGPSPSTDRSPWTPRATPTRSSSSGPRRSTPPGSATSA